MKRFFSIIILFAFVFDYCFLNCSVFAEDINQSNNFDKYNLSVEQRELVKKITSNYVKNVDLVEKLVQKDLLNGYMELEKNRPWDATVIELYMFLMGNSNDFSESKIKNLKKCSKKYFIRIDDKYYRGISKIDIDAIQPNSKIRIFRDYEYNLKRFRKRDKIEQQYDLFGKGGSIEDETNFYKRNVKLVTNALEEGYYDDYSKFCHRYGTAWSEYKVFKKQYIIVKKLLQAGTFTDDEIRKLACYEGKTYIVKLDDDYYKNVYRVRPKILKNAKSHEYFIAKKYGSIRKLKQYNRYEQQNNIVISDDKGLRNAWYDTKSIKKVQKYKKFREENQLTDKEMEKIWSDTNKLTSNIKLVKRAMNDGTYEDYYNYSKSSGKNFKNNYKSYLLVKDKNYLEEEQKIKIINRVGTASICINPTYWGSKTKKIKNTLKNKRIEEKDKYKVISKRISYRRPTAMEWVEDISMRLLIAGLILSGIGCVGGIMLWAGYSDAGGRFINFKI